MQSLMHLSQSPDIHVVLQHKSSQLRFLKP